MPKETTKNSLLINRLTHVSVYASLGLLGLAVTQQIQEKHRIEQAVDCDIHTDALEQSQEKLLKCQTYINAGKIALLGFDTTPQNVDSLISRTQTQLQTLFGASVQIDSVTPSPEMVQEYASYKEQSQDGQQCISTKNFISDVARERMHNQLAAYNVVIAVTSIPGCEDNYQNYPSQYYASAAYSARSGDITGFKVTNTAEDIEMLVHEIGHSFGLKHAGAAYVNFLPLILAKEHTNDINVIERLATATYDEYGEKSTIMGSGYSENDYPDATVNYPFTLNTLQQQIINKVMHKPLLKEVTIAENNSHAAPVPYTQITTIELQSAFALHDEGTTNTHEFTSIAVVPPSQVHPGIKEQNRLELYGQNGSLTVFLGYITTDTYNKTILHFDGQDITIEASKDEVRFTSKTL